MGCEEIEPMLGKCKKMILPTVLFRFLLASWEKKDVSWEFAQELFFWTVTMIFHPNEHNRIKLMSKRHPLKTFYLDVLWSKYLSTTNSIVEYQCYNI